MKKGFTLIELLIILVIIAVMVAVIMPSVTAGSEISKVRSGARGFVQVSRYARTMAILHQRPVTLTFSESGEISVNVHAQNTANSLVTARAFSAVATAIAGTTEEEEEETHGEPIEGGTNYAMAEVNINRSYEQVRFVFDQYTDSVDDGWYSRLPGSKPEESEDITGEHRQTMSITYQSNGTCRPYRVEVIGPDDDSFMLTIVVNRLGVAKVLEDEE